MSLSATFPNDIPLSSLEPFDPNVVRTIYSPFVLPWGLEDMYPQYDFFTSHNFNTIIGKIYDNLDYLRGFSKIYNTVIPLGSRTCYEYDQNDMEGVFVNDEYEVTFNKKRVMVYRSGVLYQAIDETSFGQFVNVRSVSIVNDYLYVLDGLYLIKLDISTSVAGFVTFFGGYGGSSSDYKFANPQYVKFDTLTQQFYIWDKDNKVVKIYTEDLTFVGSKSVGATVGADVVNGEVYSLTSTGCTNVDSGHTFLHSVSAPRGLVVDSSQLGFLWIYNSNQIYKYTINGLHVGTYEFNRVSGVCRNGTKLYVIDFNNDPDILANNLIANLDYTYTQTISTSDSHKFDINSSLLHPDELASDWVINDTMYKIYDNLNDFNLSLTGVFVANLDGSSTLGSITTDPRPISGVSIDCDYFQTRDEIISCSSLKRPIVQLYDLMDVTRIRLLGLEEIDDGGDNGGSSYELCWSLGAQSCEGIKPQLFNANFTPLSFTELSNPEFGECNPLTGSCCLSSSFDPWSQPIGPLF